MTWLIVLLGGLALAVVSIFALAHRGLPYTIETLGRPIRALLRQGYRGGFLIVKVSGTKKFVQLSKYIEAPGVYGIQLGFPRAPWSADYYDKLLAVCVREGIAHHQAPASAGDPLDFVFVDFGKDFESAHNFVRRLLTEIMNVDENARLWCRLENAAAEDRIVDR